MTTRMVGLLVALLFPVPLYAAKTPPHIVLMMADDLGWGDVGYHGSKIDTPHIDQLAAEGVRLEQFYAQPVCSPTRGALLTGRYPIRLGLQCGVVRPWAKHGLPLEERTLATALKEAGYTTAIVGKWHLGHSAVSQLPTERGFDHQYGHYNGALDYFTHRRDGGFDWHRNDQRSDDQGYATDLLGREAVRLIEAHDKRHPLFLYVPFNAPHTPLQAPKSAISRYQHMPNANRRTFAAMVSQMDKAIGNIMAALDNNDYPAENTLVIFLSDNGGIPKLGSNGKLRAGKGTLYEGGVRVPTIVRWPGKLKANSLVNEPLHVVDLYPTLVKLAGGSLDQDKPLDGHDAWPTIADGQPTPHETILLNSTPFHGALRYGDWKIIHNGHITANHTRRPDNETWELFNLAADPWEKLDVKSEQPELLRQLKTKLAEFADQAVKPNIPPNRPSQEFRVPKVWGEFD